MSLSTVEGWNQYVKQGHRQILIERGIEPTEEALRECERSESGGIKIAG